MFGEKLRAARKAAGITQEEMAEKIGVKRSVVSKYENGAISPTIYQAQKMAYVIGVSLASLVDEECDDEAL